MEPESRIIFTSIGEGVPILIVHGWEMNSKVEAYDFEPIFETTPGFRRIYIDLPGMGLSPADGIRGLDDIFARVVQFIDSHIGNSTFLLVGSSCGAYLARALARKYVLQVDGLLLRVPLVEPDDSKRDTDAFKPLVQDQELLQSIPEEKKAVLGDILIQTSEYVASLDEKLGRVVLPAIDAVDREVLDEIRSDPQKYRLSVPLEDVENKFAAPTLIVCGRHDEVVGYRDTIRLLELYPRSTFAVLDRGTHGLPIDEHKVFEALVCDWVQRIHEWRSIGGKK